MEALLAEQSEQQDKLNSREVVWVKVVQVAKDQVLVDVGEKSEGLIPTAEFPEDAPPAVGKRVPALLIKRARGDAPAVLSTQKARMRLGWDQIVKAHQEKARVKGRVTSSVKGGFLVDINGVSGFMPSSQSDIRPVRKPDQMIGTGVRCYIIELDSSKQQFILSRRQVLEEDAKKRRESLLKELKAGMVRIGRIMRINEHGVFIDIGGLEGLVRPEDIAWKDPEAAKAKLSRGQKVRVRIIKIETDSERVALGLKQLTAHPGEAVRRKYPVKTVVKGEVTEILKDEGVRIKLAKGDPAFCPARELPAKPGTQADPRDSFSSSRPRRDNREVVWPKEGEAVTAIVMGVHSPTFEVAVSIRRYEAIQDRKSVAQYLKKPPPLTLGQLLNPDEAE